jgi:hypothetical protein
LDGVIVPNAPSTPNVVADPFTGGQFGTPRWT